MQAKAPHPSVTVTILQPSEHPTRSTSQILIMASQDDDLQASKTEGYKIGEKKTVEEYAKLGRFSIITFCCA